VNNPFKLISSWWCEEINKATWRQICNLNCKRCGTHDYTEETKVCFYGC